MLSSTVIIYSKCLQPREWQLAQAGGGLLSQLLCSVSSPFSPKTAAVWRLVFVLHTAGGPILSLTQQRNKPELNRKHSKAFFEAKAFILKSDIALQVYKMSTKNCENAHQMFLTAQNDIFKLLVLSS